MEEAARAAQPLEVPVVVDFMVMAQLLVGVVEVLLEALPLSMEEMEHLNTICQVQEASVVAESGMVNAGSAAPVEEVTPAAVLAEELEVAEVVHTTPEPTKTTQLVFSPTMAS